MKYLERKAQISPNPQRPSPIHCRLDRASPTIETYLDMSVLFGFYATISISTPNVTSHLRAAVSSRPNTNRAYFHDIPSNRNKFMAMLVETVVGKTKQVKWRKRAMTSPRKCHCRRVVDKMLTKHSHEAPARCISKFLFGPVIVKHVDNAPQPTWSLEDDKTKLNVRSR